MISMLWDRIYSTDRYAKAITNAKAWTATKVRIKVKELSHMKFYPMYSTAKRHPLNECTHEYLMDIFEEALNHADHYRRNAEHGANWIKMCFITPKAKTKKRASQAVVVG